jgi:hypothetical protein
MGVYLINVHLTGAYLMRVYLTGVHLISVYLTGVHFMDVYFMDVYFMDMYIPDLPPYKRWSIYRDLSCKKLVLALVAGGPYCPPQLRAHGEFQLLTSEAKLISPADYEPMG